ncbi:hypothetical protein DEHRE_04675 [Dehalobacter restrictus DSM 9455]|uniref:Uncharacterized protein n=1 Tax=Dehalobacter restrictus (strain DSM 9455 / PER-K23) TaxID=871738 RepID=A0ABN4BVJ9_DEHRP|nr:hypothetical protein DEHRE_04675 [Dehalobacter restrictus DSM 9455]
MNNKKTIIITGANSGLGLSCAKMGNGYLHINAGGCAM